MITDLQKLGFNIDISIRPKDKESHYSLQLSSKEFLKHSLKSIKNEEVKFLEKEMKEYFSSLSPNFLSFLNQKKFVGNSVTAFDTDNDYNTYDIEIEAITFTLLGFMQHARDLVFKEIKSWQ